MTISNLLAILRDTDAETPGASFIDEVLGRLTSTAQDHLHDAVVLTLTTDDDMRHNGVTRCDCGSKYWVRGTCVDCLADISNYVDEAAQAMFTVVARCSYDAETDTLTFDRLLDTFENDLDQAIGWDDDETCCVHCGLVLHHDELGELFDSEGDRTCPTSPDEEHHASTDTLS